MVQRRSRVASDQSRRYVQAAPVDPVRFASAVLATVAAFFGYLVASEGLDRAFVETLSINRRSGAADAFGPFVTLLGLIYSIILGQIYSYYFDRQGTIQDCLFQEVSALHQLKEITVLGNEKCILGKESFEVLHRYGAQLQAAGFTAETELLDPTAVDLLRLVDTLDQTEARAGLVDSSALCRVAGDNMVRITEARAKRVSAIAGALPSIQGITQRVISVVILLGFVLVDLGAPKLEALLFAVICGCFFLINSFLDDLADPFSGTWSINSSAKEDLERLMKDLEQLKS